MTFLPAPDTAIVVVAAGSGTRLGADVPKAFAAIDAQSILRHALERVFAARSAQVIVVAPAGFEDSAQSELRAAAGERADRSSVVTGGETRQQSVLAGLGAVWPDVATVLVHDAARALTPPAQIDAVAQSVTVSTGVIPALPVVDTLKRVSGSDVAAAVDRSELVAAQTPQGFPRALLERAYEEAAASGSDYTDDAALFAAAGFPVRHIPGSEAAFKITTPADLDRARHLLGAEPTAPRVGVGTDVHAFGGDGSLWLAGLEWPDEPALAGHSDGDAVAHAIVDALLSAAGLGDIGEHFGTDRPEFAGAHADAFLAHTRQLVQAAGFAIGNVSVQFQSTRPRFAARRAEAQRVLSAALGGAPVSVSATTTDSLGFTGRGEGVAATAVALLLPHR